MNLDDLGINTDTLPILSQRVDTRRCGRCDTHSIIVTEYEDPENLKYPIVEYYCENCEWNYVESER
jgi:hypothetical protein